MSFTRSIVWILFFIFPLYIWGQEKSFESRKLQQMASELSKEFPYINTVYHFTETYLSQLLQMNTAQRELKMRSDGVRIEEGGLNNLRSVNEETILRVAIQDRHYIVTIAGIKATIIRISFPMSYQLITGKSLKEIESDFIHELTNWSSRPISAYTVNRKELQKTAPGMYIKRGEEYYIEEINNHQYYLEKNGEIKMVYEPAHIAESFFNLMTSENLPCEMTLRITIRQYGFKTQELKVPLKQWISYCAAQGCSLFVGVEKMGTDKLTGCVYAVNEPFKYVHVLNVEFPYSLLEMKSGVLEADLMVFIPTHNLQSLFEEFNMHNKK